MHCGGPVWCHGGTLELLEGRKHEREGLYIFYCDLVKTMVVNAGLKITILLAHKEKTCPGRRGGRADETGGERVLDVVPHSFNFKTGERKKMSSRGAGTRQEIDCTIVRPMGNKRGSPYFAKNLCQVCILRRHS